MSESPRQPVLVGCGQVVQRVASPGDGVEPLELMARAALRAEEDSAASGVLREADSIRVARGVWKYSNPGALLRTRFGATRARTGLAPVSGNMIQRMIDLAALDIAAGRLDVVLVVGGEAEHSKRRARAEGIDLGWTVQTDSVPDDDFGGDAQFMTRYEIERGLTQPAAVFSLFENALRHARGESLDAHRARVAELWAGFSRVARGTPYAWTREPLGSEEIGTPSPSNRLVAWPYTKRLCANMVVDQAAAVIVCSLEAARRLGVDRERCVFLHAACDAQVAPFVSERRDFRSVPALGAVGRRALELAETRGDEIAHRDLYSCFPAAVQLAAAELDIPLEPAPTVTGGLGFAGGPFNSYVLHSTATMMNTLRDDPGSLGLVGSIGGWFQKLAFAVYSTRPPARGFRHADLDGAIHRPGREIAHEAAGPAAVETYALRFGREGPRSATVACLRDDGRRAWAVSDDEQLLAAMQTEELCGRRVALRADGTLDLL